MEPKNHKNKFAIILVILAAVIAWCFTIFKFSDMNSANSNNTSTGLVEKGIMKVLDATNEVGITDSHPDDQKLAKAAELVNAPLRKVVHATVYFVLALILLALTRVIFGSKKYLVSCIAVIALCFVFALTDEYHQTFVAGRTGQILDVLIDTAGVCIAVLLFSSYFIVWKLGHRSGQKPE